MIQINNKAIKNIERSEYTINQDKNNQPYISYYDEKYKRKINIYCNPDNSNGTEDIKKALKSLYLSKYNI